MCLDVVARINRPLAPWRADFGHERELSHKISAHPWFYDHFHVWGSLCGNERVWRYSIAVVNSAVLVGTLESEWVSCLVWMVKVKTFCWSSLIRLLIIMALMTFLRKTLRQWNSIFILFVPYVNTVNIVESSSHLRVHTRTQSLTHTLNTNF